MQSKTGNTGVILFNSTIEDIYKINEFDMGKQRAIINLFCLSELLNCDSMDANILGLLKDCV